MADKWRKIKLALGLNCLTGNNGDYRSLPPSDAASLSQTAEFSSYAPPSASKRICSICLTSMKPGDGQAIFTAECSHIFHFQCIASNVKHGNKICPVCRAKWKDIPLQGPGKGSSLRDESIHGVNRNRDDTRITFIRRMPPRSNSSRNMPYALQVAEPVTYDDDEPLESKTGSTGRIVPKIYHDRKKIDIATFTEFVTVPRSTQVDTFTVLINLKAPSSNSWHNIGKNKLQFPAMSQNSRAPVDLVTVLDTSGSMAGTKLALLKRAMGFVIQNLGLNDRLSVISFSSTARRIFPLRRMSETGKQQALQAVNSLVATGGTNIAEGLRKGAKIIEDRNEKNPISSIILLSDGQDTYTVNNSVSAKPPNYELLLPLSVKSSENLGFKIPVHTFGFGVDHDPAAMHSISEISGGTFSFIETELVIQDAFAQCIGGLLSVVVKDLQVRVECCHPAIHITSLKVGSYPNRVLPDQRLGTIDVGNLYADEERDFLITINIPKETMDTETSLLKVRCLYADPLTELQVNVEGEEVRIERTNANVGQDVSIEVDRQRSRIQAAEAMTQASSAAERGDMAGAISILENIRRLIHSSVSAKSHDKLCISLDAELKEMQERMATRNVYEASGRAYILSGLSSHSWQRATARGDSTDFSSLVQSYQTPSMVEMVTRSQAVSMSGSSNQKLLRPIWSFGSKSKPS